MKPTSISKSRKARGSAPKRLEVAAGTEPECEEEDSDRPAVGTLARTKSLLLAALRVWELKNGYRSEMKLQANSGQDGVF